ncbi:hypothetical protein B0W47_07955 [Komagataeibacter nataicola]|uniref:Uncharacterized protein n=1 Tax=Komagataeibacter nataicola TaxID=265960 RepID=A0A9N7H155_9PROT|nr:hypothetical protein [Komagataeibacter nataicola]AQU87422.1 hypothetical protein B0W47_07955 [Komagataeibacter nataicola]PYD65367.1 hypothetical protein CDI09_13805 [Komagataeibacter nataicola]WEQ55157.1 hypothetical protein LV564_13745 [Komagataeibacter nataicola]WNM09949.1 hypothetical protein RI056_08985 [Komagataeibacter nataicola]GBR24794.1 hypothetical protein AA0616_2830 [Komagataeibacter nataicola NRIC 0616]
MKKLYPAIPLLVLVLLVGSWGVHHFAQHRLEAGIADFRASIGPNATFSYATARPRTLARGAHFTAVTYHNPAMTLIAADVRLGGLTGNNVQGEKIGSIVLRDVKIMTQTSSISLDEVDLHNLVLPNTDRASADSSRPLGFDSLVLDQGTFTNMHLAIPASQTDVTVAHMTVDQYGMGRASHLDLDRLATQINLTPTRRISVDHIKIDGPDFASEVASLIQSGHLIHESHPHTMDLRKVEIDSTHPMLQIDHVATSSFSTATEDKMDTTLSNFMLWSTGTDNQTILNAFGYDHFNGNIHINSTSDRSAGRVHLEPMTIESADMGNLTVVAELDQIPFDDMAIIPETARIVSAAMTWEDHSLAAHVLAGLAKSRDTDPEIYRQNLLASLASSDDASLRAMGRFLQSPQDHPLQIALRPMKPVNLMMLGVALSMAGDPSVAAPLGLTISTP